jgi:hypothetical protein
MKLKQRLTKIEKVINPKRTEKEKMVIYFNSLSYEEKKKLIHDPKYEDAINRQALVLKCRGSDHPYRPADQLDLYCFSDQELCEIVGLEYISPEDEAKERERIKQWGLEAGRKYYRGER